MTDTMIPCDFCMTDGRTVIAEYDGRTVFGPCAYMCSGHFAKFGMGLGQTRGRILS